MMHKTYTIFISIYFFETVNILFIYLPIYMYVHTRELTLYICF